MDTVARLKKNIQASISAKQQLIDDEQCLAQFSKAVEVVIECYQKGGRIYIGGNGGSAADAQHLAAEFVNHAYQNEVEIHATSKVRVQIAESLNQRIKNALKT